jgi:hypothetical protein
MIIQMITTVQKNITTFQGVLTYFSALLRIYDTGRKMYDNYNVDSTVSKIVCFLSTFSFAFQILNQYLKGNKLLTITLKEEEKISKESEVVLTISSGVCDFLSTFSIQISEVHANGTYREFADTIMNDIIKQMAYVMEETNDDVVENNDKVSTQKMMTNTLLKGTVIYNNSSKFFFNSKHYNKKIQ